jgi:predicted lysophospholipase L1 biosynthesis ABC-type transport system permease subunit
VLAWAVLTFVLKLDAQLLPLPVLATLLGGVLLVTACGIAGTWRALQSRPAPYLRAE